MRLCDPGSGACIQVEKFLICPSNDRLSHIIQHSWTHSWEKYVHSRSEYLWILKVVGNTLLHYLLYFWMSFFPIIQSAQYHHYSSFIPIVHSSSPSLFFFQLLPSFLSPTGQTIMIILNVSRFNQTITRLIGWGVSFKSIGWCGTIVGMVSWWSLDMWLWIMMR
jgi:hypothetical protein